MSASRGGLYRGGLGRPPGSTYRWGRSASRGGWAEPRPSVEINGLLRDTVNKRAVRILLECFLVLFINLRLFKSLFAKLCVQCILNHDEYKYFFQVAVGDKLSPKEAEAEKSSDRRRSIRKFTAHNYPRRSKRCCVHFNSFKKLPKLVKTRKHSSKTC